MYFEIREDWKIKFMGRYTHEYYFNIRHNLKDVKAYIKDWIETWKDNAEDNEYKFLDSDTDYKTYAKCRIKKPEAGTDMFIIKVIQKEGTAPKRTALSMVSFNENMEGVI